MQLAIHSDTDKLVLVGLVVVVFVVVGGSVVVGLYTWCRCGSGGVACTSCVARVAARV